VQLVLILLGSRCTLGTLDEHKVGFGLASVVDSEHLPGTLGEGPGRYREGAVFRVVSLGKNVQESLSVAGGSVIRCVGIADTSLSLSLSLVGLAPKR
jgi:hypothetical protein